MRNLMRPMVLALCAAMLLLGLMGCAGSKPGEDYVSDTPKEIEKLIEEKYSEAIYAVGTATGPSEQIAKSKGEMQARAEIARQFKSQIDVLQKSYEEAVNDKSLEEYKQVMEIFASLEITGTKVVKSMVRKEKGSYSAKILVVVSAEQFKAILDEKMQAMTSFRASQAYKELEDRVARERQRVVQ